MDAILKILTVVLMVVLVAFFFKTQADVEGMETELSLLTEQTERTRLENKDMEYSLRDEQKHLERTARENADYAHPEERVFVDASGVK